ncbi:uncharacterized protein LTHEOB_12183 [Neofusicoccum parvum]|uniref:Uncharacterized protein LTHEOB_12183 n=1 Tax=Neofusicoccum parvum TaxID=310453 RepID=A0ACB5RXT2_9PEZI|nr:uncharacterized protein LTHEOB_12183 [Neofusicoccum parvum]
MDSPAPAPKNDRRKRVDIPAFLQRSGVKLKEGLRAQTPEPAAVPPPQQHGDNPDTNRSNRIDRHSLPPHNEEQAARGLPRSPIPHQGLLALRPRSFLSKIATATPTTHLPCRDQHVDDTNTMKAEEEARRHGRGILSSMPGLERGRDAVAENVESGAGRAAANKEPSAPRVGGGYREAWEDEYDAVRRRQQLAANEEEDGEDATQRSRTISDDGGRSRGHSYSCCDDGNTTPPSSLSSDDGGVGLADASSSGGDAAIAKATGTAATKEPKRPTPAMAAWEVACEYQRRVDRDEVKAPADADRANYVNWKRNYLAHMAKKQRDDEGTAA